MELERRCAEMEKEICRWRDAERALRDENRILKTQNQRLLKRVAQYQSASRSVLEKRIILSHAEILFPENVVIGDRMENCVLKIYRGNSLLISESAQLLNCRVIALDEYSPDFPHRKEKSEGSIDIKGFFFNTQSRRFAISSRGRVVFHRGARFRGNVCAGSIIVSELTRVRGRLVSRELWEERKSKKRVVSVTPDILQERKNQQFQVHVGNAG